ncbi:MAG: 50S ribosomal protein L21e [archaeon]|nr:50S ribosomal protein L21e [archaeon]
MPSKKAKGKRKKTRDKLKSRGKATVNKLLQEIPVGATVNILINSSRHDGMPDARFHGFTGKVVKKQGSAVFVDVGKLNKKVLVGPAHISVVTNGQDNKEKQKVAA